MVDDFAVDELNLLAFRDLLVEFPAAASFAFQGGFYLAGIFVEARGVEQFLEVFSFGFKRCHGIIIREVWLLGEEIINCC
jgi:hypothetical protein